MTIRLINGNEVIKSCVLLETGEEFFETRDGIFNETGRAVSRDERPDVWQVMEPNAVFVGKIDDPDIADKLAAAAHKFRRQNNSRC